MHSKGVISHDLYFTTFNISSCYQRFEHDMKFKKVCWSELELGFL